MLGDTGRRTAPHLLRAEYDAHVTVNNSVMLNLSSDGILVAELPVPSMVYVVYLVRIVDIHGCIMQGSNFTA